ncbi:g482 [Coccomyxa viridis]|uniref:G482 protein n=1 Tax=Coccomyxa viridis TaxID=1274662 RepID=A0ABP1FJV0_9CHLO
MTEVSFRVGARSRRVRRSARSCGSVHVIVMKVSRSLVAVAFVLCCTSGALGRSLQGASGTLGLQAKTGEAKTVQEVYEAQVDQLADMISTVFMVHSGSNLQTFSHLNTSLVVTAAEMACQTFFSQVELYIQGTFDLVKNLPEEFKELPGDIQSALAPENQPDYTQLKNETYLMQSFEQLVGALEAPFGVVGGGAVFSYAPCFVNLAPAAVSAFATGISVAPSLAVITPEGVNIQPQGLNIQPVLVTIFPVGVNVQPQGLNISPALIAVTPGRVSINPQGGSIGPALISVAAAQAP